jgi:hypothetical protein
MGNQTGKTARGLVKLSSGRITKINAGAPAKRKNEAEKRRKYGTLYFKATKRCV